jgi:hypothetical protein
LLKKTSRLPCLALPKLSLPPFFFYHRLAQLSPSPTTPAPLNVLPAHPSSLCLTLPLCLPPCPPPCLPPPPYLTVENCHTGPALPLRTAKLSPNNSVNRYAAPHCKEPIPQNRNKYSQKRNCVAKVLISTCMCLWAKYIFPRSICQSCCRKYVDRSWEYINRSQTHECRNWDLGCSIPRKGIHLLDFICSAPLSRRSVNHLTPPPFLLTIPVPVLPENALLRVIYRVQSEILFRNHHSYP